MTFGVIYTCLSSHSLLFVGMLASLYDIILYNTTTVTTAGMQCTGTNCETTNNKFVCEYHYKGQEPGEVL